MIVYLDGRFMPAEEAKISVFDRGFLYGDGLFETMRAYQGKIFALNEHLRRIQKSAKLVEFNSLPGETELIKATRETVKRNQLRDGYVRLTVTRGVGGVGLTAPSKMTSTVLIVASQLKPYGEKFYEKGMKVTFLSQRRGGTSIVFQLKSTSFLASILGKIETQRRGADEGIFLSERGEVTEGTVSNVFMVKDDSVFTPPCASGLLPGVTRQIVCFLAQELSLGPAEKVLWPEDVMGADEVFLTNSLMEVMSVREVDGQSIGSGEPGPITKQLHQAYRDCVASQLSLPRGSKSLEGK